MKEDYVSFEVAKLLKEKGFAETSNTIGTYNDKGEFYLYKHEKGYNHNHLTSWYSAPTLQMAMKWLREKHIIIAVTPLWFHADGKCVGWAFNLWADDNLEVDAESHSYLLSTYEEACEAAIKYCLENLI